MSLQNLLAVVVYLYLPANSQVNVSGGKSSLQSLLYASNTRAEAA